METSKKREENVNNEQQTQISAQCKQQTNKPTNKPTHKQTNKQFGNWQHRCKLVVSTPNLLFPLGETSSNSVTWGQTSVPAKWHLIPSTALAGCSHVTDDIQMDRPRYGNMCRNRRNRIYKQFYITNIYYSNGTGNITCSCCSGRCSCCGG